MKKLLFTLLSAMFALACSMSANAADEKTNINDRLNKAGSIIQ